MNSGRYSRNEALFGANGQRQITQTRVGIVGLGGLGSHVAQQLAYLGVVDQALVDADVVTESSLNRVIGAVPADVGDRMYKVDVARRVVQSVQPEARVRTVRGWIDSADGQGELRDATIIFGCVDNDLARLRLVELASSWRVPYIDLATDTGGEGAEIWYGGRVVFALGDGCPSCLDLLDQREIRQARMSPDERELDDRLYGVRPDALGGTGPAVVSLNGVVASLGVTEFIAWRTGLREPARQLTYRGDLAVVRRNNDRATSSCFYCERWRGGAAEAA